MYTPNDLTRRFIALASGASALALVLCLSALHDTMPSEAGAFASSGGVVADAAPAAALTNSADVYAGPAVSELSATAQ
jgi:hypothetical protein